MGLRRRTARDRWDRDPVVARHLAVVRALPDAYVITDPEARIVEVNEAWSELTGLSASQAVGAVPPYPWWPDDPDDRARRMAPIQEAMAVGYGEWELDIESPAGRLQHVRFTTTELLGRDGRRLGFLSVLRDQTARVQAEERLRTIQLLADGLAGAVDLSQVAAVMLAEAVPALGAAAGSVGLLIDPDMILVVDSDLDGAPIGKGDVVSLHDRPFIARAVRTRQLVAIEGEDDFRAYDPVVADRMANLGMKAALLVPLLGRERALGLLGVTFRENRRLDENDRELCAAIAGQCALAVERAQRYEHEHTVATTLQASYLATDEVDTPGVEVAVRYQPAVDVMDVGGDWYDVIALPDGRIGLAVGDVVGRGLAAAAVMGQVRSAMRALALTSDHPAEILVGLDRFARHTPAAQVATVAYAVLDPATRTLRYASAGHVPPHLVTPEGRVLALAEGTSWPLDTRRGARRVEAQTDFPPGSTLLLYTDGLVERRGESIDVGLARLEGLLADLGPSSPQALCDELMARLVRSGPRTDDVALLCVQTESEPAVGSFVRVFPPLTAELGGLRAELRSWLRPLGAAPEDVADILLAVSEASANAMEHPQDVPAEPIVTVEGMAVDDAVVLTVTDGGRWREPGTAGPGRGRGFGVMRAVMDEVKVEHRPGGTAVVLRRALVRPGRPVPFS
jgi:PAS domain S-box-containing protein